MPIMSDFPPPTSSTPNAAFPPTREPAATGGDRLRSTFVEDGGVEEMFRGKLADYIGSGYDRGHMVSGV